uniref:Hydrolethalus syndrome protein 1 homolog n=1 Tax=Ciona intestinalis TaxID=7719 RepID=H2XVG6_CIOIN|nr:hydrolethalus syndrome protein 1 homolog [Ciona intestinalis]|eukprot:XP_002126027.1 hydrolethalus syndrome protein 1 homolog [Ciona intestinalis]
MESISFSDNEIKQQLAALGYFNVSEDRMKQFRKDLHKLIEHDQSTTGSSSWFTGVSSPTSNSGQSEFSETSDKNPTIFRSSMKPASLSRFQPHLQVDPHPSPPTISHHSPHPMDPTHDETQSEASDISTHDQPNYPSPHFTSTHPSTEASTHWTDHVFTDATDTDRTQTPEPDQSSQKVIRKRKVLRKQVDGTPRVYNESLVEDNNMMYRMKGESLDDSFLSRVSPRIPLPPRPNTARPALKEHYRSAFEEFTNKNQPPSFIRPSTTNPHTRNLKKVDPVNKYHQYKEFWSNIKAPGEKSHRNLRWEVKAQMMYKEEPAPKPQRVYVPNTYVVPTSKKRSALRWEVRHAMEHGLPIPTAYDVY